MNDVDLKLMKESIAWAERCKPISDRYPKVGAIISVGDVIVGRGHRGCGSPDDDEHAEKNALVTVHDDSQLSKATVYTTLEPCTPEVRSDPLNCCSELIYQAGVKRVFIGILDPNQAVTGKGLWQLQSRGIDVELFPPDLAKTIRSLNSGFIKEQQTLGIQITNTANHQLLKTYDNDGVYTLEGTYLNPPGEDVFALTNIGAKWWPQPYPLTARGDGTWFVKLHFGSYEDHMIWIVRASELGMALMRYYRNITAKSNFFKSARKKYAGDHKLNLAELNGLSTSLYPAIEMTRLPKGLQILAQVSVKIAQPPKTA